MWCPRSKFGSCCPYGDQAKLPSEAAIGSHKYVLDAKCETSHHRIEANPREAVRQEPAPAAWSSPFAPDHFGSLGPSTDRPAEMRDTLELCLASLSTAEKQSAQNSPMPAPPPPPPPSSRLVSAGAHPSLPRPVSRPDTEPGSVAPCEASKRPEWGPAGLSLAG